MEKQEHNNSNGMEYKREFIRGAIHILLLWVFGLLAIVIPDKQKPFTRGAEQYFIIIIFPIVIIFDYTLSSLPSPTVTD